MGGELGSSKVPGVRRNSGTVGPDPGAADRKEPPAGACVTPTCLGAPAKLRQTAPKSL